VLFAVSVLNEGIVLRAHGIGFTAQGFALFNALVLAKVMPMVEARSRALAPAPAVDLSDPLRSFPSFDPVHCFSRR